MKPVENVENHQNEEVSEVAVEPKSNDVQAENGKKGRDPNIEVQRYQNGRFYKLAGWLHSSKHGGFYISCDFNIRSRGPDGSWKSTSSIFDNDLLIMSDVYADAYRQAQAQLQEAVRSQRRRN